MAITLLIRLSVCLSQFADFKHTQRRAMEAVLESEHAVPSGCYVTLRLLNVPLYASDVLLQPVVAWGLLRHECKVSVVHYAVQRHSLYTQPIMSKVCSRHCLFAYGCV